jgi:hypothetical protein
MSMFFTLLPEIFDGKSFKKQSLILIYVQFSSAKKRKHKFKC